MAVTYFPFNSIVVNGVPDRPANAENLAAYLAGFFSNGVLLQEDTALQVVASSGMNVQINAGSGNINGKTILNDSAEIITLEKASASLDRIDRVVFRLDTTNRLMEFDVLKGTPASNPVAPELTQGADVYELCLAEIRVPAGATSIVASHITDTRVDETLCGIAAIPPHMQDLEHGGTGVSVKTLEELLLALRAASFIKLWENASPTSAFSAQNISVANITEYELFIVVCRLSASNGRRISGVGSLSSSAQTGNYGEVQYIDDLDSAAGSTSGGTSNNKYLSRRYLINVNGYIAVERCTCKQNTTVTETNSNLIPVAIYGIKGVQ